MYNRCRALLLNSQMCQYLLVARLSPKPQTKKLQKRLVSLKIHSFTSAEL